jgi:hypothetical protein
VVLLSAWKRKVLAVDRGGCRRQMAVVDLEASGVDERERPGRVDVRSNLRNVPQPLHHKFTYPSEIGTPSNYGDCLPSAVLCVVNCRLYHKIR